MLLAVLLALSAVQTRTPPTVTIEITFMLK